MRVKPANLVRLVALVLTLGFACTAMVAAAQHDQRLARVGVLLLEADGPDAGASRELREGLRELGWAEGHAVVASGTAAALAAQRATKTIPIVMAGAGDPLIFRGIDPLSERLRDLRSARAEALVVPPQSGYSP